MPVTLDDAVQLFREIADNIRSGEAIEGTSGVPEIPLEEVDREEAFGGLIASHLPCEKDCRLERLVHRVASLGAVDAEVYGLDGSSKPFDSSKVQVAVLSVAATYVDGGFVVATYPHDGVSAYISVDGVVAAVGPPELVSNTSTIYAREPLVDPSIVESMKICNNAPRSCEMVRSMKYGRGYDRKTMVDENRVLLETKALETLVDRASQNSIIFVDGPLYATPGLYKTAAFQPTFPDPRTLARIVYTLSYIVNDVYRARVVTGALQKKVTIVGVVKRLSASKMLIHAVSRESLVWSRDVELVEHLVAKLNWPVAAVGPVYTFIGLGKVLEKVKNIGGEIWLFKNVFRRDTGLSTLHDLEKLVKAGYTTIGKKSYYLLVRGIQGSVIIRVELPCHVGTCRDIEISSTGVVKPAIDPEEAFKGDENVLSLIAYYMLWPGPVQAVPIPILIADRTASRVARAVLHAGYSLLSDLVSVSYETLMALEV